MSVAFILFTIQNEQFRCNLKKLLFGLLNNLRKPSQGTGDKESHPRHCEQNHGFRLDEVAINRMPHLNEDSDLQRMQIQLRREIQRQYGVQESPQTVHVATTAVREIPNMSQQNLLRRSHLHPYWKANEK